MKNIALGLVEVRGYLGAVAVADAALKAASVTCIGLEIIKGGLVTVKLTGDVGAVQAAVEAGAETAAQLNVLLTSHVIARLHEETAAIVMKANKDDKQAVEQPAANTTTSDNTDHADTDRLDTPRIDAGEANVAADAVKKESGEAMAEADEDKPDFGLISAAESAADTTELPEQAMNKSTSQIIVIDLPKEPAKAQAGPTGASLGMKSKKPVVKETNRNIKTKKARL